MHLEVRHRHLTSENERHGPRERAKEKEQAAEELENPRQSSLRHQHQRRNGACCGTRRKAEQLLTSVLHEHECRDDAEDAESDVGPARTGRFEQIHGLSPRVWDGVKQANRLPSATGILTH